MYICFRVQSLTKGKGKIITEQLSIQKNEVKKLSNEFKIGKSNCRVK
jgi:hypothetical protein